MALNHSNGRDLYDSSISSELRAMEELTWIQIMVIVSNWNIGFLPTNAKWKKGKHQFKVSN